MNQGQTSNDLTLLVWQAARGPGGMGLAGVGPSAGFGNNSNAVVNNFFLSSLK